MMLYINYLMSMNFNNSKNTLGLLPTFKWYRYYLLAQLYPLKSAKTLSTLTTFYMVLTKEAAKSIATKHPPQRVSDSARTSNRVQVKLQTQR